MVKYILFVKMKDNSIEQCEKVKALFLSMKEQIPPLWEVQVGIGYLHSQHSYDVVLELVVDDRQALEDYQKNIYHVGKVKPYIHAVRSGNATAGCEY